MKWRAVVMLKRLSPEHSTKRTIFFESDEENPLEGAAIGVAANSGGYAGYKLDRVLLLEEVVA